MYSLISNSECTIITIYNDIVHKDIACTINTIKIIIAMSFTKSQVIPESYRANVMNWFRVPMNIITCAALLCLHVDWISHDKRIVFGACLIICVLGLLATNGLLSLSDVSDDKRSSQEKDTLPFSEDKLIANDEIEKEQLLTT